MKRLGILFGLLVLLQACGGGGGGGSSGGSSSSSSSSGGTPTNTLQYGDKDSTTISLTIAAQDANGNMTLQLNGQSFQLHVASNGYSPISEFNLSVDTQGATMQICQNGTGLFNVFPADATPISDIADIVGQSFFSVSLCTSANLQGDYLSFNSSGIGVHFNAAKGSTSLLLPSQVAQMLSPGCNARTENCLRIFRIVRNGAPLYFIHAPWPGALRLWQGPGLRPF